MFGERAIRSMQVKITQTLHRKRSGNSMVRTSLILLIWLLAGTMRLTLINKEGYLFVPKLR